MPEVNANVDRSLGLTKTSHDHSSIARISVADIIYFDLVHLIAGINSVTRAQALVAYVWVYDGGDAIKFAFIT